MESEPQNFCYVEKYTSPFVFLKISFAHGLGFFVFWTGCIYALFGPKIKKFIACILAFFAPYALINSFFFPGNYGPMEPNLDFMQALDFSVPITQLLLNFFLLIVVVAAVCFFIAKNNRLFFYFFGILLSGLIFISASNIIKINSAYKNMEPPNSAKELDPIFHLSKTGKNVLVFMQDKLAAQIIDESFEESPGLAAEFEGFVYYPNAVSFAPMTMLGTPGIFGGYSYTPYESNLRTEKTIQQKHNEAILSMPVTFTRRGWSACVSDMPYENFYEEPVTDMYKDYPEVQREWTNTVYTQHWFENHGMTKSTFYSDGIKHNFIMVGIFKAMPPILRHPVYYDIWWDVNRSKDQFDRFIDSYSVLEYLPMLFDGSNQKSSFIMIDNMATHDTAMLQYPEYKPVKNPKPVSGDNELSGNPQFQVQVASLRRYGDFFEYLRENNLYDNTRIIIVSDHGAGIAAKRFPDNNDSNGNAIGISKERLTSALLVKDFDSRIKNPDGVHLFTDMTFMTNADTPALATKDIFENEKNPFTGLQYKVDDKDKFMKLAFPEAESTRNRAHTRYDIENDQWVSVTDDIYDSNNWKKIYPFGE